MSFIKKIRTTKPDGFVAPDKNNPTATKLASAFLFNEGLDSSVFDIVNGIFAPNEDPIKVFGSISNDGRVAVINNDTGASIGVGFDLGDPEHLKIPTEITIIVGAKVRNIAGGTSHGRFISKTNGSTGDNFSLQLDDNSRAIRGRINGVSLIGSVINAEQPYTLALRYKSGLKELWIDGVVDVTTTTQTDTIPTAGNVKIGSHGSAPDRGLRGDLNFIYVFNHFLQDEEMVSVMENPWGLLEPEIIYIPQEVAIGTGNATASLTNISVSKLTSLSSGAGNTNASLSSINTIPPNSSATGDALTLSVLTNINSSPSNANATIGSSASGDLKNINILPSQNIASGEGNSNTNLTNISISPSEAFAQTGVVAQGTLQSISLSKISSTSVGDGGVAVSFQQTSINRLSSISVADSTTSNPVKNIEIVPATGIASSEGAGIASGLLKSVNLSIIASISSGFSNVFNALVDITIAAAQGNASSGTQTNGNAIGALTSVSVNTMLVKSGLTCAQSLKIIFDNSHSSSEAAIAVWNHTQ